MNRIFKKRLIVESILLAVCTVPYALAAPLVLPTTPLITGSAVKPNMMLLLDSSGSMSHIVQDAPYNEDATYFTCVNKLTGASTTIKIHMVDGAAKVQYSGTDYTFGNGSGEKCFDDATIYTKVSLYADSSNNTTVSSYGTASYKGHYLNWYFNTATGGFANGKKTGTFTRMEITKTAANDLLDELGDIRVGLAKYDGSDGAQILANIDDLSTIKSSLKTAITGINNSGYTPLGESLADIGRYFTLGYPATSALVIHPDADGNGTSVATNQVFTRSPTYTSGLAAPAAVTQYWCQQNFVVAMTDGIPTNDGSVSTYLRDYDNGTGEILDDVALALFDIDLRPDLKNGTTQVKNNVTTHIVGFADETVTHSTLMQDAADNGGGIFIGAKDSSALASAFTSASQSVFAQVAAMTAVSFNTSELSADSALYQAGFNTAGWKGSLKAFELSDTGAVATNASWDAAELLDNMTSADRNIFTYNGTSGTLFNADNFTNFSITQKADLYVGVDADGDGNSINDVDDAKLLVNYIRGDKSNEGNGAGNYRVRSSRLGDIVNSSSVYVGKPYLTWPNYGSNNKFGATDKNYSDFKAAKASRTPMVYVGANDGMLHGFNAELTGTNKGKEKFSYIPGTIASSATGAGLHYLADKSYAHQFYVDLTPTVSDVYIGAKGVLTTKAWRSLLIGGLRSGGKGLFALDVTDPDNFTSSSVLWEFNSTLTGGDVDFGYSYSKPTVAMMANGKWAVIVGNGYNNGGDGKAKLFILFIEGGLDGTWTEITDYIELDTGVGSPGTPNGLSTPTVVDTDWDGVADRVYAGDLQGNMWVFDVTHASNTGQWSVAYKSGSTPKPLFTARNSSNEVQPITTAPSVTTNPNASTTNTNKPNLLVFFGTGKYLEASDVTGNKQVMSYYSVLDANAGEKTRGNLTARTLTTTNGLRKISGSTIDWTSKLGWYVDLPISGERVISDSLVRNKVLFFNTVIPSGDACSSGGESWLMSLSLDSGLAPSYAVFDANNDGVISDANANGDDYGDLGYVGQSFDNGLASESGILGTTQYTVGSTGILEERQVYVGESTQEGRLSWQELIRD